MSEDIHLKAVEAVARARDLLETAQYGDDPLPLDDDRIRAVLPPEITESAMTVAVTMTRETNLQRMCLALASMLVPDDILANTSPVELISLSRFVNHGAAFGAALIAWLEGVTASRADRYALAVTGAKEEMAKEGEA